ncbi:MAG: hypothetical protein VX346_03185 [Planctomycetota bacterium]|nr:hypothetical protein [Planctomycetota bacterium]
MLFYLLTAELLAVFLLVPALVVACVSHSEATRVRLAVAALAIVLPGLVLLAPAATTTYFAQQSKLELGLLPPMLQVVLIGYVAGVIALGWRGFRVCPEGIRASHWPRARLATRLCIAIILLLLTLWKMDTTARQELASVRDEASALALAVAPPRVPDRDNAALVYKRTIETMATKDFWPAAARDQWLLWIDPTEDGHDFTDVKLTAFMKRQQDLLQVIRDATELPGCYFERDYARPSIDMQLPELGGLRDMQRLLALQAHCQAAQGHIAEAVTTINAMYRLADHTGREPVLVTALVTIAMEHMANNALQYLCTQTNFSLDDLQRVAWPHTPLRELLSDALQMEEAFGLSAFCSLSEGRHDLSAVIEAGDVAQVDSSGLADRATLALFRIFLLAPDLTDYRETMQHQRTVAAQSYAQAQDAWDRLDVEFATQPRGILTSLLVSGLRNCSEAVIRAETERRCAQVALAVYRYHLTTGNLPESLGQLSPAQMALVPSDLYTQEPLRMKQSGRDVLIYSVGPDLADDDGADVGGREQTGDLVFRVTLPPAQNPSP